MIAFVPQKAGGRKSDGGRVMPITGVQGFSDENELGIYGNLFRRRYPPIKKIRLDPMRVNTSKDHDIAELSAQTRAPELEAKVTGTIEKKFIPIDFSTFRDVGYTVTKAGVKIDPHKHPGVMFGIVVEGSLTINHTTLNKFD
jgi:hypothetical protein